MVQKGVFEKHSKSSFGPLVGTRAIYGAKRRFLKTLEIVMWASIADMSDSWSKMVFSRITYFDHVGLTCGHERFMVQNGVFKNHLVRLCGPQVRTCAYYGAEAFLENTRNRHVGPKCGHERCMVKNGVLKITYFDHRVRTCAYYGAKRRF